MSSERDTAWAGEYRAGKTLRQLASEAGVSRPTVAAALRALGVEMRPAHRRRTIPREQEAAHARAWFLKDKYGITPEQYDAMLAAQGGHCAVCPVMRGSVHRERLYVDHDHETGKVRGLLCSVHNVILGLVKDDSGLLEALVAYLKKVS